MVFIALCFGLVNIALFTSRGSIDARNFEAIFRDIALKGADYIPDCLNYLCPSNMILTKFPPGHALIFYAFSFVFPVKFFGDLLALKSLIMLFYVATLGAYIWFTQSVGTLRVGRIVLYFSLFSLILNTQGLAYTDVLNFPFLIVSILYILQKKYFLSGCLFSISCLMKWQPIILLPVVFVYLVFNPQTSRNFSRAMKFMGGLLTSVMLLYPFTSQIGSGLFLSLRNAITHTATYALNPQWIVQNLPISQVAVPVYGSPTSVWAGIQLVVFTLSYGLVCWNMFRYTHKETRDEYFLHALLLALGTYYLFSFGVHENHFILGSVIALLIYAHRPTKINYGILRVVDLVNSINMFVFYGFTGVSLFAPHKQGIDGTVILAIIISSSALIYLWRWLSPSKSTITS